MKIEEILEHYKEIRTLMTIKSLLEWDARTQMPTSGSSIRAEQMKSIARQIHRLQNHPDFMDSVLTMNLSQLPQPVFFKLKILQNQLAKSQALSEQFVGEHAKALNECRSIWPRAKEDANFELVRPYLEKVIALVIERSQRIKESTYLKSQFSTKSLYEVAMDDYDMGSPTQSVLDSIEHLARETKKILPFIIEKVKERKPVKAEQFSMPIADQHKQAKQISATLGFDFNHGRLDTTEHPFAIGVGSDQRITTRYNESNYLDGLYSVIHETGHGIYEQQIPIDLKFTPQGKTNSMMIHESQSRFYEVFLCMSRPFCDYLSDKTSSPSEDIFNYLNKVEVGFIRTESDEVTYNLHIAFRSKIERMLMHNELSPKDLPNYWNDNFENEFGLRVSNDRLGCLQDVHWYTGDYGYFPSYTVGNMIAAELFKQFSSLYPTWPDQVRAGNFSTVKSFLYDRVHRHGALPSTQELISISLKGQQPSPSTLISYFKEKYL